MTDTKAPDRGDLRRVEGTYGYVPGTDVGALKELSVPEMLEGIAPPQVVPVRGSW